MTGLVLSTAEYGSRGGLPTVGLHGGYCTGAAYARIGSEALPERRWICPDLRGHGSSPRSGPWTLAQLARDVLATADALGVERFDVIGHSLGGVVSAELMRMAPSRIKSAVLLDPPLSTPDEYQRLQDTMAVDYPVDDFATLDDVIEPRIHRKASAFQHHLHAELAAMTEPNGRGGLRFRANKADLAKLVADVKRHIPASVGTFSGRVLLVAAGLFDAVTEAGRRALRAQLGDRLMSVTIHDSGHSLLWDAFDETVLEIKRFLETEDQARLET
ncbi:MAG: lipase [Solirubrobacteraceae bacterium]